MKYKICKLTFSGGVHFGDNSLERSEITFHADTLFSALCLEAVKESDEAVQKLYDFAACGRLLFSDAFPFIEKELYLPKPYIRIHSAGSQGDSVEKKKYKKLQYIPAELYDSFLKGDFPIDEHGADMGGLGVHFVKTSVSVREEEEPKPYRVGSYRFNTGCGLYFLVGAADAEAEFLFTDLIAALSLAGIGGRRSTGYGRFECKLVPVPSYLEGALTGNHDRYVTLSVSLPDRQELEEVTSTASYQLIKRSGFVQSGHYSNTPMRKRDLYVFDCGSVFTQKFSGGIYDVSSGGRHPVYRYAKPIFLGVDV